MLKKIYRKEAIEYKKHHWKGKALLLAGLPAWLVDGVAYFTLESREEAAAILDSIRQHAPFEGEFTRGLYFKGTN